MPAAAPDPTQRLLRLAAYLKSSFEDGRDFDLDTVTGQVPDYEDDAPRRSDGTLERGTRQYESLRRKFRRDCEDLEALLGIMVAWDDLSRTYRVQPPFFTAHERVALVAATAIATVSDDGERGGAGIGDAVGGDGGEVFVRITNDVGRLRDAIASRSVVTFTYNGKRRELEPYALAYRDDHWYVAGRDRTVAGVRAFRLDRVANDVAEPGLRFRDESDAFVLPPGLDPDGLFRFDPEEWGADPPVTARVRVAADVAPRFQLLVRGRIAAADGDTVEVEAEVRNRAAFRDRVLSFRDQARVLGPPELVAVVDDWLRAIAEPVR